MPRTLRILHTSDLHLGDRWADSRSALAGLVDLGLSAEAHALIMAGDIFDDNRVDDEEIYSFLLQVERFDRPVILLPGNHDCYDDASVYVRPLFHDKPRNLLLLTDQASPTAVDGLDLEVWGAATVDHSPSFHPLARVPDKRKNGWYVVVAHGLVVRGPEDALRSSPIFPEEIASAACDYIALGHVDLFREVTQGAVPAYYSGSPRKQNGKTGTAVVLELSSDGPMVEVHRIEST
jgi:DNA repair exonuclease SbcCD nuclease subunit